MMTSPTILPTEEAAQLLLRRAGLLSLTDEAGECKECLHEMALSLAAELREWPLTLELSGAYIKMTGQSLPQYLQMYHEYRQRLPASQSQVVAITFAHLKQVSPLASSLLEMGAFLAADGIPLALLRSANTENESDQNASTLDEAIALLLDYGIATRVEPMDALSLHPLVQKALRGLYSPQEQQLLVERALLAMQRWLATLDEKALPQRPQALAHIQQLNVLSEEWQFSLTEVAEVFAWAASLLNEQEAYQEAIFLLRRALAIWVRTLGPSHPLVATVMHNLASLHSACQDYSEAESLLHKTIRLRARLLGPDHLETLSSLHNLAYIYAAQGKEREAEMSYHRAFSLGVRSLGQEHSLVVEIQSHLAVFYWDRGKFAEAEPWLEQVCAIKEKQVGPAHLETASFLHKLAVARVGIEKWAEAELLYLRVLPVYQRALGKSHAETLQCLEELTLLYALQKKADALQALAPQVIEARRMQARGANTVEAAVGLSNLAGIALGRGETAAAETLLQQALDLSKRTPELGNPMVALNLSLLAAAAAAQQQQERALSLLQQALATWEQELEPGDPRLADIRRHYQELVASVRQSIPDPSAS